ncbi:heme ABC transporter ATP-binding protein [Microvirga sp. 2MCAF35]|uniref:heme ABC transporter ATP-binding protein n=1 Tax=Microvirga sp. 2MCAF35 TaxID=3232987 RepID=UPI003F9659A7
MSPIYEARRVSYRAGGRALIEDIDLSIAGESFTIIIGPNGAGKSTLLRVLCGELAPSQGEVVFNGVPLPTIPAWRLAHGRAVMPQASELGFPFTVLEVARLGVEGIGRGLSRVQRLHLVVEALEEADVAHLAGQNYQTLSGGKRQRVHFARVLAQLAAGRTVEARQVLFLDEPVASLDLKHQLSLLEKARCLTRNGVTVVAVLHDLQLAAEYGSTLALMRSGRLIATGSAESVLSSDNLSETFGVCLAVPGLPPSPWTLQLKRSEKKAHN